MFPFFESIRVEGGVAQQLNYHRARMQRAVREVLGKELAFNPADAIPVPPAAGVYKCRLDYDADTFHVGLAAYTPRSIQRLALVFDDEMEYPHKYSDRKGLDKLFGLRGTADDVLIIKKGLVTDTSIGNILLFRHGQWFTPGQPLLRGTMRQFLLDTAAIQEAEIRLEDLRHFELFKPVNAMVGLSLPSQSVSGLVGL